MKPLACLTLKTLPLLLAALPMTAAAQANRPAQVLVTAPKPSVPLNAHSVDVTGAQAPRTASGDTATLLRSTPGVSLYGAGGASSLPAIHGLADDRLRIKVDGMDLISACGNHMNPPLSYIDPTSVDAVTVFAGLAPVSSGGDSIGGTILVDSAAPAFAKAGEGVLKKGEAGVFYRSNGDARGGNLSATIASEKVSVTYSGSTVKADNYHAGDNFKSTYIDADDGHIVDADEVGSSMYKSTNQSIALAARFPHLCFEMREAMGHGAGQCLLCVRRAP